MPPKRKEDDEDGNRYRPNTTPLPISSSIPISRPPLSPPKTSLSNPRSNNPRFRRVKVEEEVGKIVPSKENNEKGKSFEDEFLRLVGLVLYFLSLCDFLIYVVNCDFIGWIWRTGSSFILILLKFLIYNLIKIGTHKLVFWNKSIRRYLSLFQMTILAQKRHLHGTYLDHQLLCLPSPTQRRRIFSIPPPFMFLGNSEWYYGLQTQTLFFLDEWHWRRGGDEINPKDDLGGLQPLHLPLFPS